MSGIRGVEREHCGGEVVARAMTRVPETTVVHEELLGDQRKYSLAIERKYI